jgi:hypothetical protein
MEETNSPKQHTATYRIKALLLLPSLLPSLRPSLVIARSDPVSPHAQFALRNAIPRDFFQNGRGGREGGREGGSDDLEVDAVDGSALLVEEGVLVVGGEGEVLALGREGGREGGKKG